MTAIHAAISSRATSCESRPVPRRTRTQNVAFLIEELVVPGGTERQCVELARGLAEAGVSVQIITLEGRLDVHAPREADAMIPVRSIGRSRIARALSRWHPKLGQAWDMARLARVARGLSPDTMLVPHHYPAHWAAALAIRGTTRRATWVCNDWIYSPLPPAAGVRGAARRSLRAAMVRLDATAARAMSRVLALSYMTGRDIDAGYGVKSVVFRTGATPADGGTVVAPDRVAARTRLGFAPGEFVVACICILMPHRRVDDAIRAAARLPTPERERISIVHAGGGDAALQDALAALAAREGVAGRVRFLGRVSESVRASLLAAADAFVFPVQGQSWGLAPFEAMSAGLPVVLSRSSGAAEVLRDGREALLYEPGDVELLARHFATLMRDRELAASLAAAGHRRWRSRFTWARAARRFGRLLYNVASQT